MHEVSIIESLVAMVEAERKKQAFSTVRAIHLQVGALGCVQPQALRFCFDAVARGTIAEGARLDIEMIAGQGFCARCRRSAPMMERFEACPLCGEATLRITAGSELRLADMEVV